MKKIIMNKRYDTETAVKKAEWDNRQYGSLHFVEEALYRKKNGEFFLYGHGGAGTQYAESVGSNSWSGGERIMPLTYQEAQAWAQEHLDGDKYEAIFGPVIEDDSTVSATFRISVSTLEALRRAASLTGRTISEIVDEKLSK